MEAKVVIDEKTKQRYKLSPTCGATYHLVELPGSKPVRESNVVEKLGRLRKRMAEMGKKISLLEVDLGLEVVRVRVLKNALRVRRIYVECPDCNVQILQGDEHAPHCRHYQAEAMVKV